MYGCMQSAILWYNTFKICLEEIGFRMNRYDPCVANMQINNTQCTICWYVDDTKISHRDPKVVDKVIHRIESQFGTMTTQRGKKLTFVGMDLEITHDNNKIKMTMRMYIDECIERFGER